MHETRVVAGDKDFRARAAGVAHLVEALGMTQGWATFLGASIGLFGADQVREWGRRIAERRVR